jgi:acyl-coenzyme A thioesterase PaaI-like protein
VQVTDETGRVIGDGAIGFASVAHRAGDPPLPTLSNREIVERFASLPLITQRLHEAAGIVVVDAAAGTVEVDLTPELMNPAGTLQGAMTALIAEVAAEELLSARSEVPIVVTDLDIRYLDRTAAGPIRSRTDAVGDGPDAAVVVELVDGSTDTVVALVHARGVPVSPPWSV